jgi:hypothetical protein
MPTLIAIAIGMAAALAVLAPTATLVTPPDTVRIPHEDTFIDEGASAACGFPVWLRQRRANHPVPI